MTMLINDLLQLVYDIKDMFMIKDELRLNKRSLILFNFTVGIKTSFD